MKVKGHYELIEEGYYIALLKSSKFSLVARVYGDNIVQTTHILTSEDLEVTLEEEITFDTSKKVGFNYAIRHSMTVRFDPFK